MAGPAPNSDKLARMLFIMTIGGVIAWVATVSIFVLR